MPVDPPIPRSAKDSIIPLLHSAYQAARLLFGSITGSFLAALLVAVAILLMMPAETSAQSPELEAAPEVAAAGFYQLRWYSARPVELEESQDPEFSSAESIYRGSDAARVMSGKPDGDFYYRVRDTDDGTFSNVVKVTVRHHSLARALAFFSLGAIVFLATLLLIATGARGERGAQ
jgi:amino acid transporter